MNKQMLLFKKRPSIAELEGLKINDAPFVKGEGHIDDETIIMTIPNTFRFRTWLEFAKTQEGNYLLVMTEFLSRGLQASDMEDAFDRIGFKNPEIETQMRALCESLVEKGLAEWKEIVYEQN